MIEQQIESLAKAINRLCDTLENTPQPTVTVDTAAAKPEPEKKAPPKKKAAKKVEPKPEMTVGDKMDAAEELGEEMDTVEEAIETLAEIPTVEEQQKQFGVIAQNHGPVWVISAIKHLGGGRLSDLADDDRGKLQTLVQTIAERLDENPELKESVTPQQLIQEITGG